MLFHRGAPDSGPGVRLAGAGSDELLDGSAGVGVEVGVKSEAWSAGVADGTLVGTCDGEAGTCDGEAGGPAEGGCDEESAAALAERLEGSGEGESARIRARGLGSADQLVGPALVVCAGVGSCGSVQTTGPSATYHTSLCRFSSFRGLRHSGRATGERQSVNSDSSNSLTLIMYLTPARQAQNTLNECKENKNNPKIGAMEKLCPGSLP